MDAWDHGVLVVMLMGATVYTKLDGWCLVTFLVCSLLSRLAQLVGSELDSQEMIKWYIMTIISYVATYMYVVNYHGNHVVVIIVDG